MVDKEMFLKVPMPEKEVDLPGLGTVRVRGLSRAEVLTLSEMKGDTGRLERAIIRLGVADPQLSDGEVAAWYESAPAGHTDLIVDAVSVLSGMSKEAPKSGVLGIREQPGT